MQTAEDQPHPLDRSKDFMLAGSEKLEDMTEMNMTGMKYLSQQNGYTPPGTLNQELLSFSKWIPFGNTLYTDESALKTVGEEATTNSWYEKWFKWYYIIPAILVFCYVVMLSESFADSRRSRKDKKEGMQQKNQSNRMEDDAKIRGIIKLQRNAERKHEAKKHVSFKTEEMKKNLWEFTGSADSIQVYFLNLLKWMLGSLASFFIRIYELWILPGVYLISRSV